MRVVVTLAAIVGSFALSNAQLSSTSDGSIICPETPVNASYCAGASLSSNIIIRCNGRQGTPGNCNDNLAGVDPIGVKSFAPCYQSSPEAGDAVCSFNGVGYNKNGSTFPIPGYSGSDSKPSYVAPYPTDLAPTGVPGIAASYASSIPGSYASSPAGSFTSKVQNPVPTGGSNPPGSFPPSVFPTVAPSVQPSGGGSVTTRVSPPATTAIGGSVTGSATGSVPTSSVPTPLPGNGASGLQGNRWTTALGIFTAVFGVAVLL